MGKGLKTFVGENFNINWQLKVSDLVKEGSWNIYNLMCLLPSNFLKEVVNIPMAFNDDFQDKLYGEALPMVSLVSNLVNYFWKRKRNGEIIGTRTIFGAFMSFLISFDG